MTERVSEDQARTLLAFLEARVATHGDQEVLSLIREALAARPVVDAAEHWANWWDRSWIGTTHPAQTLYDVVRAHQRQDAAATMTCASGW